MFSKGPVEINMNNFLQCICTESKIKSNLYTLHSAKTLKQNIMENEMLTGDQEDLQLCYNNGHLESLPEDSRFKIVNKTLKIAFYQKILYI